MRCAILVLLTIGGCASSRTTTSDAPGHERASIEIVAPDERRLASSDAPPRVQVIVHRTHGRAVTLDAIAAVRFGEGVAYVDPARRLIVVDGAGHARELASEIAGRPIADALGQRLAWTEPRDLVAPALRTLRADDDGPITIATAPGPMTPIAFTEHGTIELLGSANGGVAGRWTVDPRDGSTLRCITNCALRVHQPWGDDHVPLRGAETGAELR